MEPVHRKLKGIFTLISQSMTGRSILEKFLPEYHRGHIRIEPMDADTENQLTQGRALKGRACSGFEIKRNQSVIYIDFSLEKGVLAPLLFHEIVHSLDQNFIDELNHCNEMLNRLKLQGEQILTELAKKTNRPIEKIPLAECPKSKLDHLEQLRHEYDKRDQKRILKSELRSYNLQRQMVDELCKKIPEYAVYIRTWEAQGYRLRNTLSEKEIIEKYNLWTVA